MIPRIPLFAPANRRKAKPRFARGGTIPAATTSPDTIPAVLTHYPPEPTIAAPRTPPPTTPIPARADHLATATRYGPIPAPDEQHRELGIAWRMNESERLAVLAELGGDLAAHQTVQAEDEQPNPRHCR